MRPLSVITVAAALAGLTVGARAAADELSPSFDPSAHLDVAHDAPESPPILEERWPVIGAPSRPAFGLEGYGGVAAEWTRGEARSHAIVGALLRLRYHYFQAGALAETSDSSQSDALAEPELDRFHAYGGFAGVFVPYSRWVDFDASCGLVQRTYVNHSTTYGPTGLRDTLSSLVLRVGVSDRTSRRSLGARIGGAIVTSIDLGSRYETFHHTFLRPDGTLGDVTGQTPIGGVTVALVFAVGLELGGAPERRD
jgi:hypothetical protein